MYKDFTIGVVGDFMVDVTWSGTVERLSPEAYIPIMLNPQPLYTPGGAGNVAMNVKALGAKCISFVSTLTKRTNIAALAPQLVYLPDVGDMPIKNRYYCDGHQLFRADKEERPGVQVAESLVEGWLQRISSFDLDAIIISDYDKGVMTKAFIDGIMSLGIMTSEAGRELTTPGCPVPIMVDPKFDHYWDYSGATIFKVNREEYQRAHAGRATWEEDDWYKHTIMTDGANGLRVVKNDKDDRIHFPAHSVPVSDVCGAGDTVMAVLTLEYLRTGDIYQAAELANIAGGIAVSKPGIVPVGFTELANVALECGYVIEAIPDESDN